MPPKRRASSKKGKKASWFLKLLLGINVLFVVFTLIAYLAPVISPEKLWLPAFGGLSYPFLLVANLLFILIWLFYRPKNTLLSLFTIISGLNIAGRYFQLRYPDEFDTSDSTLISVTTQNVRNFEIWAKYAVPDYTTFDKMVSAFNKNPTDILCLQEAVINHDRTGNLAEKIRNKLNYSSLATATYTHDGANGMIILGKGIKKSSGIINHGGRTIAVFADLETRHGVVRIYSVHLQSAKIGSEEFVMDQLGTYAYRDPALLRGSKTILRKLKLANRLRARQADIIHQHIASSPFPVIVCGDLNDTPCSYIYSTVKKGLNDTFVKAGRGTGRTYHGKFPSYRIDYIFASDDFSIKSHSLERNLYGDHHSVTAWLSFQPKNAD
jgi:endonuclease/exonuclease/phosphatase family metal-dependent hydrolase